MSSHDKFAKQQKISEQESFFDCPEKWGELDQSHEYGSLGLDEPFKPITLDDEEEEVAKEEESHTYRQHCEPAAPDEILADDEDVKVGEDTHLNAASSENPHYFQAMAKAFEQLNSNTDRDYCPFDMFPILFSETDDEIVMFLEQLAYITVSQSMNAGEFQQFSSDITKKGLLQADETMLLSALFGMPSLLRKVAPLTGKVCQELRFPDDVISCRKVLQDKYERRTFSLDSKSPTSDWFHYAARLKTSLSFTPKAIILLHFWFKLNQDKDSGLMFDIDNLASMFQGKLRFDSDFHSEVLSTLSAMNISESTVFNKYRRVEQVKQFCARHIKGQDQAIATVSQMVAASFSNQKSGPLGITTFMGAAGTGKTVLAETLADSLNEIFGASYRKLVLNMEMYSDYRSSAKLFGSGSQYADSALGDLTTEVFVAPRCVVIFDEIEKAHPTVIQSLLTILEKGQIADHTTNKMVDFSQCFFIFTTNLGHKAASKAMSQNKQLDLNSLLAETQHAEGLSPELISRLARGGVALFRELEPRDLLCVAEQAADAARTDITICWPDNLAELIIESLGGNLEPRSILSQAAKLRCKIVDLVYSTTKETEVASHIVDPEIKVVISENITDFHFAVVTKDRYLKGIFKTLFNNCFVLSDLSELSQLNTLDTEQRIQAVLIQQPLITADTLTTDIATPNKGEARYYSFGLKGQELETDTNVADIEKCYALTEYTASSLHTFIQQVAKRNRLLANVSEFRKRKMTVEFDYHLSGSGNSVLVTLRQPAYQQRFTPDDFEPVYMQEPCIPDTSFKDLLGLDELKQKMSFIMQKLRGANDFVLDMPKGYLLAGLPGTGKSYFAKAVAGECQVPFIPVNAADLMQGDVIGNINHLFNVAERYAPCIVFLDEIDAIALNREQNSMAGRLAVNTLLTRLDGFKNSDNPLFVLAATNFVKKLDPALMRHGRFDKVVTIPLPDLAARMRFIKRCAEKYEFQLAESALTSFAKRLSGVPFGFIETLFRDIQLTLLTEQRPFTGGMLDEQLLTATIGNKKAVSSFSYKARLATAYHETGHYLLSKHWYPDARCTSLSIQGHEAAGGVTVFDYDGLDMSGTKANFKARLQILLAGRAAEKLLSKHEDDISTGASHDIQHATRLAKLAITDCGFSDSLGLADFSQLPMLQPKVEAEVLKWLNTAYQGSEAYLKQNWKLVKYIAEALFEQETLDQDALDQALVTFDSRGTIGVN